MDKLFIDSKLILLKILGRTFNYLGVSNRITYLLIYKRIHQIQKDRILKISGNFINNYIEKKSFSKNVKENEYIWIMWWQGIDKAPDIVQSCVRSVIKNNPQKQVVIITQNNINKYIRLPSHIIDKFQNDLIKMAGFSDIVRMSLLSEYGGMWIDSTVLCTKKIPENWFTSSFFSCKSNDIYKFPQFIPLMRWSAFLIASDGNSELINFCKEFYYDYWKHEDSTIVYHLIDYIIDIGYSHVRSIKDEVDQVTINNEGLFDLADMINQGGNSYEILKDDNNYLFKLSYKFSSKKLNSDNNMYREILERYKGDCSDNNRVDKTDSE